MGVRYFVRPVGEDGAQRASQLSRALADAVNDQLISRNPATGAHRQPESPEQLTWTSEQLGAFLDHVARDRLFALWRVAATTGLRRGELLGLRWKNVDLRSGRIVVAQQRAKGGGAVQAGPTKTKRARRLISIDDRTAAALRSHGKA